MSLFSRTLPPTMCMSPASHTTVSEEKNPMGLRGDAIVQFDYCVGEILNTLEKLGLRENTLIILSSDNGPVVDDGYDDKAEELLNGHSPAGPLRGNKYSAFEGGTRIPAIVSWPAGVKKGMTSDLLVSQVDWLASLASLTGATMPKNTAPDSYNYLGSWLGKEKTDRPWVIEQASITRILSAPKTGNTSNRMTDRK